MADLVIERLHVTDDVAASKHGTDAPVDDRAREEQVLEQVRRRASATRIDPEGAVAFFQDQMVASKMVQQGLLERWATHPQEAPVTSPDLGRVRERLDRLTAELLHELKVMARTADPSGGCDARPALTARFDAAQLDPLHRRALETATRSLVSERTSPC